MFKRILVPLDTSKLAEIAIPYAAELAVKLGSEVILAHVRSSADTPDKNAHRVYLSKITAGLEQAVKKSPGLVPGEKIKVTSAVLGEPDVINHPADKILDYAEKENVSLIVLATHGWTGIRRWALGSTANNIARASKCPVLLIRAEEKVPNSVHLKNILVPLDGSRPGEAVIPYVENLVSKLKSKVTVLNVVETPFHIYPYADGLDYYGGGGIVRVPFTAEEMKPLEDVAVKYVTGVAERLKKEGVDAAWEVRIGFPGDEISKKEKESHPDMVAMTTHGHSGFGRLDHGSVADKVLHHGSAPLLLVRPQKSK
jgi:nucleotide-binding universal stress UspA family protein